MRTIYLETPRVTLREIIFEGQDAAHLLDLDSDPEVMTFLTDGKPSTPEDIEAAMRRIQGLYDLHQHRMGLWIAEEKSTAEFIGWFHMRPCKHNPENLKTLEIGYRLKKKFWGQGFAPEVSKALIHKGFTEFGAEKIFAITMAKNTKSRKVMEKIGLKFEGSFIEEQFPGEDKNAVKYSILKALATTSS
jgi:RimJ/RimL family protein N-acetyltransferase